MGADVTSVHNDGLCVGLALVLLEGVAPLAGKGTADFGDVIAFLVGAIVYRLGPTRGLRGTFSGALRCGVGGKCLSGSAH